MPNTDTPDRNSEWQMRAPTVGMSTRDIHRNALAKEMARYQMGQAARAAWMDSFVRTSPMAGGSQGNAMAQPARQDMQQQQYQVGGVDDALAGFNAQLDAGEKLLRLMRERYEAQQPGLKDYARQVALTVGPRLIGL